MCPCTHSCWWCLDEARMRKLRCSEEAAVTREVLLEESGQWGVCRPLSWLCRSAVGCAHWHILRTAGPPHPGPSTLQQWIWGCRVPEEHRENLAVTWCHPKSTVKLLFKVSCLFPSACRNQPLLLLAVHWQTDWFSSLPLLSKRVDVKIPRGYHVQFWHTLTRYISNIWIYIFTNEKWNRMRNRKWNGMRKYMNWRHTSWHMQI